DQQSKELSQRHVSKRAKKLKVKELLGNQGNGEQISNTFDFCASDVLINRPQKIGEISWTKEFDFKAFWVLIFLG
ncbi:hypothetical protein U1Q18_006290, partial [Sarracenia purpurea var. burkii]